METNKLSQRLLAEGWTKDQTPPGLRPWRDFDGGWTYEYRQRLDVVFEAPCGLLWKRNEVSPCGHMSFMGAAGSTGGYGRNRDLTANTTTRAGTSGRWYRSRGTGFDTSDSLIES